MAWRHDATSDGISALRDAAADLATTEDWLGDAGERQNETWLPEPDASRIASGQYKLVTDGL